jgi:chromosome segregation ATPase
LPISWHSPLGNTIRPEAVSASHQRWIEALEAERAVTAASLDLAQLHLEAVADAPGATDAEIASLSAALDETKAAYHRARAAYFQATQGQREVEERRQRNLIRVRQLEAEIARIDRGLASHREYMDAAEQELQRREAQTVSQMEQEAA